ncbi:XRE family transcriptional regulator [Deminuibacter soli]|uniref:XRE family transcriptional regulator n=1 Tax=Deminuibacter soli TaxID=2291815 RepID=A0A3E1NLC9_9BACT|nr:XRE family transcriptional regulator [Deminuibacter soli]RFM28727.1 XRE family transcriptional regulator [Deminuibacter soli]
MTEVKKMVHHGRNIALFRNVKKYNQSGLVKLLGNKWDQKKISDLEMEAEIDETILKEIAPLLGVEVDVLKEFKSNEAGNNFYNYFQTNNGQIGGNPYGTVNFNPIEKILSFTSAR